MSLALGVLLELLRAGEDECARSAIAALLACKLRLLRLLVLLSVHVLAHQLFGGYANIADVTSQAERGSRRRRH